MHTWSSHRTPAATRADVVGDLIRAEARQNLTDAIALILEDRREEGLRSVPADAERETVTVK